MARDRGWPAAPAIYQIYPRSFADSNGDGVGDLPGITDRLDHIAGLGVDAIWLSSIYASPWDDGGYDVTDHCAVHPTLGTLDDIDALIARAHGLGLKVMLDQILNHTSCDHPWFQAALAGDDAMAKRYLFRDAKPDGTQPNNWISQFGQPAWTWQHQRRQFFFHQFLSCQPSLDLRHPEVQAAHRDQIGFWRARGIDGFRFDAASSYLWDVALTDNPVASADVREKNTGKAFNPYTYQHHLHDMMPDQSAVYAANLRDWAGDDAWLMGEMTAGLRSYELAMEFSEPGRLDAAYTTDLPENRASARAIADLLGRADPARIVKWLSSHDQPRHARGDVAEAAFLATLMAVLPGPWLIYQGEEWGLAQPDLARSEVTDPFDLLYWPDGPGREGARVPMPWGLEGANYGFSTGTPWLPMRWNRSDLTAAMAEGGLAATYRRLMHLRRNRGWATGRVEQVEHGDHWLSLMLSTEMGRQTAWFGWPGAQAAPMARVLHQQGTPGGYHVVIGAADATGIAAA